MSMTFNFWENFIAATNIPVFCVILGGILTASTVLQWFLSKARNTFVGLILPGISFIISCILSSNYLGSDLRTPLSTILSALLLFFSLNIPTMIYMFIYGRTRKQLRRTSTQENTETHKLD